MRSFQFKVSHGIIQLMWNNGSGLLDQIQWMDPSEDQSTTTQERDLPQVWQDWVKNFRAFFHQGRPLGEIPWSLLDQSSWTGFQEEVYRAIASVPFGETRTYAWVAERIGKCSAYRAVGQALRKNPLPILIPCHRIVGSNGNIGGFMGKKDIQQPELQLKQRLIGLEYAYRNPVFPFMSPSWDRKPAVALA